VAAALLWGTMNEALQAGAGIGAIAGLISAAVGSLLLIRA
jgi:hypothetical protein